jgi:hypothetical protein
MPIAHEEYEKDSLSGYTLASKDTSPEKNVLVLKG